MPEKRAALFVRNKVIVFHTISMVVVNDELSDLMTLSIALLYLSYIMYNDIWRSWFLT